MGTDHPETLETLLRISEVQVMRLDRLMSPMRAAPLIAEAATLARASYDKASRRLGPDHPLTLKHLQNHFLVANFAAFRAQANGAAKAREAEALGARLLVAQRKVLGAGHPDTLETLGQYSKIVGVIGKQAESERLTVEAMVLAERVFGPNHVTTSVAMRQLAIDHLAAGRLVEAVHEYKRFVAGVPRRRGWDSANTRSFLHELAYVMVHCGKATEAEAFALERLPEARRLGSPDGPGVIGLKFMLGAALLAQDRASEAERLLRECWEFSQRQNAKTWGPETLLGASLLAQKKFAEAEPFLITGFEYNLRQRLQTGGGLSWLRFTLWDAHAFILKLYADWNRPEKVADWKKREAEMAKIGGRRTYWPLPPSIPARDAPENLAFDLTGSAAIPAANPFLAWNRLGSSSAEYHYSLERSEGGSILRVSSDSAGPRGSGGLSQSFSAEKFCGRRVRFSLELRTMEVADSAGAFMRIHREDGAVAAVSTRRSFGTSDWASHTIVFDIPKSSGLITIGLLLNGRGTFWVRKVAFEEVGADVTADNTVEHIGPGAKRP